MHFYSGTSDNGAGVSPKAPLNVAQKKDQRRNRLVKLLVVDDEEFITDTMCAFFRNRGYETYGASSGEEALDIIEEKRPHLVLLDVMLAPGGMNGLEVLGKIKALDDTIKVIIITGKVKNAGSVKEAKELGADDYLMKPLNFEKLETEAIPKIGAQLHEDFRKAADENKRLYEELNQGVIQTITVLARALDTRDRYTFGHSERVAEYAVGIAEIIGFSEEEKDLLKTAGLLHDIGKLGIPDEILRKPGKLTIKEYEDICKHPIEGVKILEPIPRLRIISDIILHHHERCDGKGYPDRLSYDVPKTGQNIASTHRFDKMASWILQVPDSFDAMTSPRPYRNALSQEAAMEELNRGKGTQFEPNVVEAFQTYYQKHKAVFKPLERPVDYSRYPILFIGENRAILESIRDALSNNFTIEIAMDIHEALGILEEVQRIYLTIIFQKTSEFITQEMIDKIIETGFPMAKIAIHTAEDINHYDEILNRCQAVKYPINPSNPQALNEEIMEKIREAIVKEQ